MDGEAEELLDTSFYEGPAGAAVIDSLGRKAGQLQPLRRLAIDGGAELPRREGGYRSHESRSVDGRSLAREEIGHEPFLGAAGEGGIGERGSVEAAGVVTVIFVSLATSTSVLSST